MRMMESRRRADLCQEAVATQSDGELRIEYLDGDVAVVPDVVRQIHRRHAALPQLALDAVAIA
jgi:hypothetical protein